MSPIVQANDKEFIVDKILDKILGFFETDEEVDFISAPFRWDKKELFAGIEDPDTFFRSSLRSFLVRVLLSIHKYIGLLRPYKLQNKVFMTN